MFGFLFVRLSLMFLFITFLQFWVRIMIVIRLKFMRLSIVFIRLRFLMFWLRMMFCWTDILFQGFLIFLIVLNFVLLCWPNLRVFRHFGVFWMFLMRKLELFQSVSFGTLVPLNSFSLRERKFRIWHVLPYLCFKYRLFFVLSLVIQNRIEYFFGGTWLGTDGLFRFPNVYVSGFRLFHKLLEGFLVFLGRFIRNYCRI